MLRIYNTLTNKKEIFKPITPGFVKMYVCGMTVYDYCHLGHARVMIVFDIIYRWFKILGLKVSYVRNITDIDDKIINKSINQKIPINEITNFFIDAMHNDEIALGVLSPTLEPKATEYIESILNIIEKLHNKGIAYISKNGDINFSVRSFKKYGILSGKNINQLKSGELDINKHDPLDFVLWKASKDKDPIDSKWNSKYGLGRPGWHIECSAMSHSSLGLPLDIHGGGPDLKFPHHENEIAQSESAFDCLLANTWIHCGPLMMGKEKMSKSVGNFFTIRQIIGYEDILNKNFVINKREAEMLRFFIVRSHYRSIQTYSQEHLIDAQNSLDKLYRVLNIEGADLDVNFTIKWDNYFAKKFENAMNDDFNTPIAISVLFELASEINRNKSINNILILKNLAKILGLLQQDPKSYFKLPTRYSINYNVNINKLNDEEIEKLILARYIAKKENRYIDADKIRNFLLSNSISLEDTIDGNTIWSRI
ncbi:Cysteine--tRNA ligase [Candidatus Kinetoplastibacterium sorsogonicusi]|uniref:Cysteine--tRNA ligase n=1 Tax=Candidatus Kinetoplastidibacterium kentomonadis TaxID=1576550 RepID=A0A3S7J9F4_9PROT|nr:cysteine--tRNA ligase [Candidatus Kinetoplastibacterium sorsogonicusi]AWD32296.1 Cysteine--tRNA ligase [Candidatus Kinetoplastibacterium sorsogonicusi]